MLVKYYIIIIDKHIEGMGYKKLLLLLALIVQSAALFAIDNAEFWNLGFSNDSRYFSFGQYWVTSDRFVANAEMNVIDVANNDFVPKADRVCAAPPRYRRKYRQKFGYRFDPSGKQGARPLLDTAR